MLPQTVTSVTSSDSLEPQDLVPEVQSCMSTQIASLNCDQQNWGCFCDNPRWLLGISECLTFETSRTTSSIDHDELSTIYCHYKSNLFTVTLTYKDPPPAIIMETSHVTSPNLTSTVLTYDQPTRFSDNPSTTTSPPDDLSNNHEMPRNSIIGIAVGIPVALFLAVTLTSLICVLRQRRKDRRRLEIPTPRHKRSGIKAIWSWISSKGYTDDRENAPSIKYDLATIHEADGIGRPPSEMCTSANIPEMEVRKGAVELGIPDKDVQELDAVDGEGGPQMLDKNSQGNSERQPKCHHDLDGRPMGNAPDTVSVYKSSAS